MANNIANNNRPTLAHNYKRQYSNHQARSAANNNNNNNNNNTSNSINNNNSNQNSIPTTNNNNSNGQQHQQITGAPLDAPADCTIACDKGHITAHKLILCDHSKYLQDILSKYPTAEHPIIILTELNIIDIKILINYMYTGELVITNDSSPNSLLRAAQILKIDSLTADVNDDDDDDIDGEQQQQQQHQRQQQVVNNENEVDDIDEDPFDAEDVDDDVINNHDVDYEDVNDLESEHEDEDDLDNNSRLINSIKNIYSLTNQFICNTTSPPPQQQQPLSSGSSMSATSSSSGSNPEHNNNHLGFSNNNNNNLNHNNTNTNSTPNSLSHHLQQLSGHLDLQDPKLLDNKNNKIRCHLCNIGLSDVKCLYRHVLTRHLPEKWGYKCEFCDREFSRDDHLMRHYTTKHKNMEFNREKIRETRRLNREMAKNFHDQISTV